MRNIRSSTGGVLGKGGGGEKKKKKRIKKSLRNGQKGRGENGEGSVIERKMRPFIIKRWREGQKRGDRKTHQYAEGVSLKKRKRRATYFWSPNFQLADNGCGERGDSSRSR